MLKSLFCILWYARHLSSEAVISICWNFDYRFLWPTSHTTSLEHELEYCCKPKQYPMFIHFHVQYNSLAIFRSSSFYNHDILFSLWWGSSVIQYLIITSAVACHGVKKAHFYENEWLNFIIKISELLLPLSGKRTVSVTNLILWMKSNYNSL